MKFAAAVVLLFALASVASARPVGLRSLLSSDVKDPIYCTGPDHGKDECPEHYECAALDEKVCKQGKDYKQECFEYACVEIPKYCEVSYDKKDECVTKYGKDLECKELDHEECVYEEVCEYEDTHVCKEYNQVQKCEKDQQVCKEYKQEKVCKPAKCAKRDQYGECTVYGEEDCDYVDTKECKAYETVKGECKYVNTTCKVFEQEEKCEDVEVCWTGKCVEVPKKEVPKKDAYTAGK